MGTIRYGRDARLAEADIASGGLETSMLSKISPTNFFPALKLG
jgi:hypothetical protein